MKKPNLLHILFTFLLFHCLNDAMANQPLFKIVSQNLHQFYDDKRNAGKGKVLSAIKYNDRINQLVEKISSEFNLADVIAFQEIENISILQKVSVQLQKKYNTSYQSILIEGNDISGMDVGYLVNTNFKVESVKALFKNHTFKNSGESLFSRPPLAIDVCLTECLTIVNVHLRSMKGLKSKRLQKRISLKRRLQAETLANWIDKFQRQLPEKKLIVVGDFNALSPSDPYVDIMGTIIGKPDQSHPRWKSSDLIYTDLINTSYLVSIDKRYSYRYKKANQLLDYLLISQNLQQSIKAINYTSIDYKFSDHAAMKATFAIR